MLFYGGHGEGEAGGESEEHEGHPNPASTVPYVPLSLWPWGRRGPRGRFRRAAQETHMHTCCWLQTPHISLESPWPPSFIPAVVTHEGSYELGMC